MNTEILIQPILGNGKPFVLGEEITKLLNSKKPKFKTANFMFSFIKADAIDILKPSFKTYLDNGGTINFYIDSDRKILSNPIIKELIELGCNVYSHVSESTREFQYKGVIFESSKTAEIFFTSGNLSLSGLFESHNIITHISYNLTNESDNYAELYNSLFNSCLTDNLVLLSVETLPKILDKVKKSETIPTITDFTKNELKITPNIDLSEPNITIEIDDNVNFVSVENTPSKMKKAQEIVTIEKEVTPIKKSTGIMDYPEEPIYFGADNVLDVEDFLFESKSTNISFAPSKPLKTNAFSSDSLSDNYTKEQEISEIPEETIQLVHTKDLTKTSIFMFQAPKITTKGVCAGEIKIPLYIRDLIAKFWGWPNEYLLTNTHAKIKSKFCTFKIVDTITPEQTLEDNNVKLFQRVDESSFSIYSETLEKLDIAENDIIRIIKVSTEDDSYYTCEIIRKDAKEYPIWEQFCTENFRSSSRKFGIM